MINYTKKKVLTDLDFNNKKVFLRCDFNVPIKNNVITDTKRIVSALKTIKYLIQNNAKIIIMSHLGRVKSENDCNNNSLEIVGEELSRLLNKKVLYINQTRGLALENAINNLQPGNIILMKNTRCENVGTNNESGNNEQLAKYWASLCDIFVNDAFATSHRAHASTAGIAKYAKDSCLGFLIETEINALHKALFNMKRPLVVILGGAKVSDKINAINNLAKLSDNLLIGGGMTYTFFKMLGYNVGKSLVEIDKIDLAKKIYSKHKDKIVLPDDSAECKEFANIKFDYTKDRNIASDKMGLDIGKKTMIKFGNIIKNAKTIIWNGPVGVFELPNFATGTQFICQSIALNKKAYSVIGGGDSAAAAKKLGYENEFSFISTGGGASLNYFEGNDLIALNFIKDKNE